MDDKSIAEQAERLSRRRARALPALAAIFISQQVVFFANRYAGDRPVDRVAATAWLVLSIVMLLALATGGGWIYPRSVRALANDETTQSHRKSAVAAGFWAAMLATIAVYFADLFEPVSGREAAHIILTIGIAAALMMFGVLERRALRSE